jgi:hypothetical protein
VRARWCSTPTVRSRRLGLFLAVFAAGRLAVRAAGGRKRPKRAPERPLDGVSGLGPPVRWAEPIPAAGEAARAAEFGWIGSKILTKSSARSTIMGDGDD